MAKPQQTSAYIDILKYEERDDGTLLVYGKATDDTLDSDQQICDPAWLDRAMPEWFKYGNIREQHSSIAAGVATEYERKDDGHYIGVHVVDPNSCKKVKSRVLKGFSVGIRAPRVVKDNKAIGGRIVDGTIVEVSLVDRPANPSCTLSLAKTQKGELVKSKQILKEFNPDQPRDENGRWTSDGGGGSAPEVHDGRVYTPAFTPSVPPPTNYAAMPLEEKPTEPPFNPHIPINNSPGLDWHWDTSSQSWIPTTQGQEKINRGQKAANKEFNPDQARDENGRWTSGDGGDRGELAHGGLSDTVSGLVTQAETDEGRSLAKDAQDYMTQAENAEDDSKHLDLTYSAADKLSEAADYESGQVAQDMRATAEEIYAYVDTYDKSATPSLGKYAARRVIKQSKKFATGDIKKFDQAAFDTARQALATLIQVEAGEMAAGEDETHSLMCLLSAVNALFAWHEGEAAAGETTPIADEESETIEMADAPEITKEPGMCADCDKPESECTCPKCNKCDEKEAMCKCAEGGFRATEKSDDTDLRTIVADIVKSLLSTTNSGDEDATTKADDSERVKALEAELAQVKALAAPSGPKRMGVAGSNVVNEVKAKAAVFRAKAANTQDTALREGYMALAKDLESQLNK